LKANGVKLYAVTPATRQGALISFPVSGGKFDPTNAKGTVEHSGALLFKAGSKSLPLKSLQLKTTQRHAPLSVKAGGGQLKLGAAKGLVVTRAGFANDVAVSDLTLSAKVATRLGKKLGLRGVFKAGQPLAQAKTVANPETIAPDGSQGILETQGALGALQLGGGQVFWSEGWFDLAAKTYSPELDVEPSPPYGGKQERQGVVALSLAAASVSANPAAQTVTVAGASLSASAATAQLLNDVFAKPQGKSGVFVAGEALGGVGFTAVGE
jgi:hypothetical protein